MISVSFPQPPSGTISAAPSKSAFHRLIIAAALSDNPTDILCGEDSLSQDIQATLRVIQAFGANISTVKTGVLRVHSVFSSRETFVSADCGESGSTLRFLLPTAAALGITTTFTGCGRLPQRPLSELCSVLKRHGAACDSDTLPLTVSGKLDAGIYEIPGNVSSQYVTGLLFALPLLKQRSEIRLSAPLASADYVRMTLDILNQFGIHPEPTENGWIISADSQYHSPGTVSVEGDWSNAAFFCALGALNGSITIRGLNLSSKQGDRRIFSLLTQFGAIVSAKSDEITVRSASLHGIETDLDEIPDLLPVLSVLGMAAHGETRLMNCGRTRLKECDRLAASLEMILTLGGQAEIQNNQLIIHGGRPLHGGRVNTYGDHRMVMAAAAAAAAVKDGSAIQMEQPETVQKSYPDFFRILSKTGGLIQ